MSPAEHCDVDRLHSLSQFRVLNSGIALAWQDLRKRTGQMYSMDAHMPGAGAVLLGKCQPDRKLKCDLTISIFPMSSATSKSKPKLVVTKTINPSRRACSSTIVPWIGMEMGKQFPYVRRRGPRGSQLIAAKRYYCMKLMHQQPPPSTSSVHISLCVKDPSRHLTSMDSKTFHGRASPPRFSTARSEQSAIVRPGTPGDNYPFHFGPFQTDRR